MIDVAIIGSGIAGLTCARALAQAGLRTVVFDKGRGLGGRCATRRAGALQFDHGAQYVTARDPGFAALLDDLAAAGAVAPWADGTGRTRLVGTPGMTALPRALGQGLNIRQNAQVTRVTRTDPGWTLRLTDTDHVAARVVVTVPAPQVAGLLGADHPLLAPMAGVHMAPCLTLMAGIRGPAPFVSREDPDDPLAWIAQDSTKPGRPGAEATAWVAQAGPVFSATHLEDDARTQVARLSPLLCDRLGIAPDRVVHAAAHRWRHARVTVALSQPFIRSADGGLYLGGDWCLAPRVEAAWISGTAIAADLLARMA